MELLLTYYRSTLSPQSLARQEHSTFIRL